MKFSRFLNFLNFQFIDKSICPTGKIEIKNNKFVCKCPKSFEVNEQGLCIFKDFCGDQFGGKICKEKNALCKINLNNPDGYECQCPDGLFYGNSTEPTQKCIPACEMRNRTAKCEFANAVCNQQMAFNSESNNRNDLKDFCTCEPAREWNIDGTKCVYSKYSVKVELEFIIAEKNNEKKANQSSNDSNLIRYDVDGYHKAYSNQEKFNQNQDLINSDFKNDLMKRQIIDNVKYFFSTLYNDHNEFFENNDILITNCTTGKFTKCEFVVTLKRKLDNDSVEEKLKQVQNSCHLDNQTESCIIDSQNSKIQISKSSLKIGKFTRINQVSK